MTIRTSSYGKRGASLRPSGRKGVEMSMAMRLAVVAAGLILLAGAAGAGVYGISRWLCHSPFFTVTGVTINGCNRVSEETILKLSGVKPDSNLLALDLDTMAHSIETHPWIQSASISKKLPDRLEIAITERQPVAMINLDRLYLLDSTGTVFKKVEKGEKFDLPLITGLSVAVPEQNADSSANVDAKGSTNSGQAFAGSTEQEQMERILEIIRRASSGTRTLGINNISEIHVEQGDIVLYTSDRGLPLRFSSNAPIKLQFQRAEKILHHLYSSGKYKKIAKVNLYYGSDTALAKLKQ